MAQPSPIPARNGLTAAEVSAGHARHGWNELPRPPRASPIKILLKQFTSVLVLILIAAGAIAYLLGEVIDTAAIGLVVLLNGLLGFVQEWRAENAIEALRNMLSPMARVVRDGREQMIEARGLVPGDIVILDAGDRVPADLRLTAAVQLRVDESVLTGESVPLRKEVGGEDDKLMMGTALTDGRAEGVVVATGAATAFGQIATLTGSVQGKITQLQRQLGRLAKQLGAAALLIALAIIALGIATGRPVTEMFMTGLSLAVAIVPEGLPAVVTITLALGASAMVRQRALARSLQAVETLGAASVICTDKTGTLTENKMTATALWVPGRRYEVTGTGYDPSGHIALDGQRIRASDDTRLARCLETALLCNHARLERETDGWAMLGEPTEGALVVLAYKGWAPVPDPACIAAELPFSSDRKRMSVAATGPAGLRLHTKGAPEAVLEAATHIAMPDGAVPLTDALRDEVGATYEAMAADGLRVMALAQRPMQDAGDLEERDLTFMGLVGLVDPPRSEVAAAVSAAKGAGIRIIMITGDSPVTGAAIARQVGIPVGQVLTGRDVEEMTDEALTEALRGAVLFARSAPAHKMRIVKCLQAEGDIVAMTGDGVNDAPALKQADIGVSMGQRGTDVAKDASDLVLLDDNFSTIVRAIREGRRQFDNVKKFVRYLLSSNAGEVIAISLNILIGGPLVFLATQILWMNLVTDGVTAVALGLEKSERDQMSVPPRARSEPIVGRAGLAMILCFGLYTGLASLAIFYTLLPQGEDLARTTAFTAMVVFEKSSVFAFRSLRQPCFRIGWTSNPLLLVALAVTLAAQAAAVYWPPLQVLLHTQAIGWSEWGLIAVLAAPLIIVPEIIKTVARRPLPVPA